MVRCGTAEAEASHVDHAAVGLTAIVIVKHDGLGRAVGATHDEHVCRLGVCRSTDEGAHIVVAHLCEHLDECFIGRLDCRSMLDFRRLGGFNRIEGRLFVLATAIVSLLAPSIRAFRCSESNSLLMVQLRYIVLIDLESSPVAIVPVASAWIPISGSWRAVATMSQ